MSESLSQNINQNSDLIKKNIHEIEKFVIRFPKGMRSAIQNVSFKTRRSMNKEIIARLEHSLANFRNVPGEITVSNEGLAKEAQQVGENGKSQLVSDQDQLLKDAIIDIKLKEKIETLNAERKMALLKLL